MATSSSSSKGGSRPTRLGVKFSPPILVMEVSDSAGKLSIHKYKRPLFAREDVKGDDVKIAKRLLKTMSKRVSADLISIDQVVRLVRRARQVLTA